MQMADIDPSTSHRCFEHLRTLHIASERPITLQVSGCVERLVGCVYACVFKSLCPGDNFQRI